jgi:hypothetical protein
LVVHVHSPGTSANTASIVSTRREEEVAAQRPLSARLTVLDMFTGECLAIDVGQGLS